MWTIPLRNFAAAKKYELDPSDLAIAIRAATNDYFDNRLIGRLFFWLID